MFRSFFLILFLLVAETSFAQNHSNRGKEFWLGYGFDWTFFHDDVNLQELAIYISTEQAATVTVTVSNTGYSQTLNIPANTVDASILIPKTGANDARVLTDGLSNKGIHIVSNVPVAAYAHLYCNQASAATMLMPTDTYGYLYYSVNYYQTGTWPQNVADWYSWFYVIASEDNTAVDITPADTTKNGWLPGHTYTVNLNKGEMYHVFGKANFNSSALSDYSKDMTGSKIVAVPGTDGKCHPFGLFSGSSGIRLCRGDGGEPMQQQMFPQQAWGTRYLTYHTINNGNTDILETNRNIYRICVTDPTTVVKKNGIVMTGLNNNFFYEYMDSTGGDYIEANKPILVAQYEVNKNQCWNYPITNPAPPSYGDPEMFYLSPIEQGQKSVLFYVSRKSTVDYVYANIHIPTAGLASLKVDGNTVSASNIIPHPHLPGYSVALVRFVGAAAQHIITSDSAFTGTAYGLGNYESYGYNFGTNINNLNSYGALHNTLSTAGGYDTSTCPQTPVKLFVKLAYPATSITWKLSQATGSGIVPNTDSVITAPTVVSTELINGRTYYVYSLQQQFTFANTGTFYIPITYTTPSVPNCSQSESALLKVVVKAGPDADFTISNANCMQDTVHLTGMSNAGSYNLSGYRWDFDDLSVQNTVNATKRFLTPGDHPVKYTIIADNGCSSNKIKVVSLAGSPLANFGTTDHICSSDSVYITDTSTVASGSIVNWYWDFGDGNTANHSNGNYFYHKYNGNGPYLISLVVTSSNGCKSDTLRKTINLIPSPRAKFGFDHSVCLGDAITFSDSSHSYSPSIVSWDWDFGNGVQAVKTTFTPFSYTYAAAGTYIVTLVTHSNNGCKSDSFRLQVAVTNKPSAEFTFSGKPCADSTIRFSSSTAYNPSVPSHWYWEYGDTHTASIATSSNSTHTFNIGTNYSVRHAVMYGGCASDTVTHIIPVIHADPIADFTINPAMVCQNSNVFFTGTASPDVVLWQWNFGTSAGNDVPPFTKVYMQVYSGSVTLKTFTQEGCGSSMIIRPIIVGAAPVINAGPDIFIKTGESKTINASISNPSNYDFLWSPSTALNSNTVLDPVSNTTAAIQYRIQATDRITGCKGYDSVWVKPFSGIFIPNTFTPNGDGKNDTWNIPALEAYPNSRITVYNRYGQKIFDSPGGSRPWDGTFHGLPQPSDVYVYITNTGDPAIGVLRGTILLVR